MDYDTTDGTGGTRENDYWAARENDQIGDAMRQRSRAYVNFVENTGRGGVWRKAWRSYYGLDNDGIWTDAACVTFGGEQGENSMIRVNQFRSLVAHILVLVTGSRPSFSAKATNSDYKSQAQARLAEDVLDHYLTTQRIEDQCVDVARHAARCSEGWLYIGWDAKLGNPVEVVQDAVTDSGGTPVLDEMGQPVMQERVVTDGDIITRVYRPENIARNVGLDSAGKMQWLIAHDRVNRWDLAARYTEFADDILKAPAWDSAYDLSLRTQATLTRMVDDDQVSVLELWHDKTDSMPDGRYVLLCGDAVLMDTPLPFSALPFIPMMPEPEDGTSFGYSPALDLLALQDALDSVYSTVLTNHDAFGRQTVWAEPGSNLTAHDIQGLTIIESNAPPQVLQMIQAQAESYTLMEKIQEAMEQISGINSVARGEPQASLKSGSALALVHAMAVQINSGLQRAYAQLFERAGTMILDRLKTFAKSKRIVEISGKMNRSLLVEFSSADISDVSRVAVELGSSVLRTSAGRKELADKFFEASLNTTMPMTFEAYLEIMTTGRLDPITQRPQATRLNIVRENEALMDGQAQVALVTDPHQLHINEHLALLDDPSVRFDPVLGPLCLAHVQDHVNLWRTCDPVILAATGQQPAPMPAMPPMPLNAALGGAPPGPQQAKPDATVNVDMSQQPAPVQEPGMPNMPNLPPGTDPGLQEATIQGGANQ